MTTVDATHTPAAAPLAAEPTHQEPDEEQEFTVEAFVASRQVDGLKQYLVKWQGYELVGAEAAYTWQWAGTLASGLDQSTYRRLVREMGQQHRQHSTDPSARGQLGTSAGGQPGTRRRSGRNRGASQ